MLKYFSIITIISILIVACDVIEPPYEEKTEVNVDTAARVVLLEEYTGFRCGYCPSGSEIAHHIKELYPNNVVLLSIHAGSLAMPTPQHKYNFISQTMKDLESFFNIGWGVGTPNGLVDRVKYSDNLILSPSDWQAAVIERLKIPAIAKIELSPKYNESNKTISCDVKVKFLENNSHKFNITLYVVEDSIVQYQTDYRKNPIDIYDYVHNNILRDALTPSFGVALNTDDIKKDEEFTQSFNKQIPANADWRTEWIRIVAVLTVPEEGHAVYQAAEKYIKN